MIVALLVAVMGCDQGAGTDVPGADAGRGADAGFGADGGRGGDGGGGADGASPPSVPECWQVDGNYTFEASNPSACPSPLSCTIGQRGCEVDVTCAALGLSFTEALHCAPSGACTVSAMVATAGFSVSVDGTFEVPVTGATQAGPPTRASFQSTSSDGLACEYDTGTGPPPTCACDTSAACEASCACDGDCVGGCACDASSSCDAGCACDADCDGLVCDDTCSSADDSECDDGGPGALYDVCDYGTDCSDCGARAPRTCSCSGRECGDDGCGGSCGSCGAGESCTAGTCEGGSTCACDEGAITCDIGCACDPDCDGNASCRVDLGSSCSPGSSSSSECCEPGMTCTCPRGSGSSCAFAVCMAALSSSCDSDVDCRDGADCTGGYCR